MDGTQFQLPGHARKLESQNNVVEVFLATLGAEVPGVGAEPVPPNAEAGGSYVTHPVLFCRGFRRV